MSGLKKARNRSVSVILALTLIFTMLFACMAGSASAAGENLAYGKSVTVTSTESSSHAGSYAVDANGSTRWSSSYADNQSITINLGSNYSVNEVKLAWEAAYASQFQIQTSTDNSTWTTVYSNYSATGGTQTISFSATTARYVKVYCIKRATSYGFSLYEVEVYAANGTPATTTTTTAAAPAGSGTNLAYGKSATASSTESSSHAASYAVDGNGTTRWSSSYSDGQSITVNLGANYSVSSVKLAWEAAYASQFQIQTSTDNSTWTTVYSNYSGTGGTQTITFSAVTARYVKMYGIKRATSYGFSLYEFEVYGSGGTPATTTTTTTRTNAPTTTTTAAPAGSGTNLAYGKSATATSTESSSYPASYAVDGNGNTRWASSYSDGQSITVNLGANYTVGSVKLAWEAAYASQFQIQTSTDNSTWTTVYSNYSGTGGTQTITFSAVTARYVKMYGIKRATSYGFSLYEFEIYGSGGAPATTTTTAGGGGGGGGTGTAGAFENIAYGKNVTATSVQSSSNAASYAVDGNGNTSWISSNADNQNFVVDLGATYYISKVKLKWGSGYASQFQLQTSTDNSTWTTVYTNYSATSGSVSLSIIPRNARYVKVYCIKRGTSSGFALNEFEVYQCSKVLEYMYSINGSKTIGGIHNKEPNSNPALQTNALYAITGQYPGLWSGDFLFSSSDVNNRWNMIYQCESQWNAGSVVNLMLHVVSPAVAEPGAWDGGVVSHLSDSQWSSLITNGGSLNNTWKSRLDNYAQYLSYLQSKGVTVMFRPFHEMNQGVFWWAGRTGTNGTAALYRLTRNYLECEKGLNNIIWVWDMQDLDYNWSVYNPGEGYWDIFALDFYNGDGYTSQKYNTALSVAGDRLIAIGECDTIPTSSQLSSQPRWVFFMSWAELTFSYNSNSALQNTHWASNVLVRNELPSFK